MSIEHLVITHRSSFREDTTLSLQGRYHSWSRAPRRKIQLLVNTSKYLQHSHDLLKRCFFAYSFPFQCLLYPSSGLDFYFTFLFTVCVSYSFFPSPSSSLIVTLGFLVLILLQKTSIHWVTILIFLYLIPKSLISSYFLFRTKSCFLYVLHMTIP